MIGLAAVPAYAQDAPQPWRTDRFHLQTSLATTHFTYNPAHNNNTKLLDLSWRVTPQWLAGASVFSNSFGQPSQYLYGGRIFRPLDEHPELYFKLTAGIIHGYKSPYENKIPFNSSGYAPGIIPSVGYCVGRICSELVLFGTAGAMLTLGVTLP